MLMPISVYMYMKFGNNTVNGFVPLLNAAVHTVMYAYYALAALGPEMAARLWWKRYITQLQLVQFVLFFVHGVYFTFQSDCDCPKVFNVFQALHALLFLQMFGSFYLRTYRKERRLRAEADAAATAGKTNGAVGADGLQSNGVSAQNGLQSNGASKQKVL